MTSKLIIRYRSYIHIVLTLCMLSIITDPALAASPAGNYSGTVYMRSSKSFGAYACYTPSQWPSSEIHLRNVRVKRNGIVTAKYWNGQNYLVGKGRKINGGIRINVDYRLSPWRFKYSMILTNIKKTSANLKYTGNTYYYGTNRSCKYVFNGRVSHSK